MRFIAETKTGNSQIKRLMIHGSQNGVCLFEYDIPDDGPPIGDYWFENLEIAFQSCRENYSVDHDAWQEIADPLEHCQPDWINPVRVVGRQSGNPQWGLFEKLVKGEWIEIAED